MGVPNKEKKGLEVIWDGRNLDWVDPGDCRAYLRGVGLRYLVGKEFEEGFRRLLKEYRPRKWYPVGLIIPCSYGKPYSQSFIHYLLRRAIYRFIVAGDVHEIIVTNAGVVPRELDEYWPYTAYDWNPIYETPEIKEVYTQVLAERLKKYIEAFRSYYGCFAAYLRWDSDSWRAVRMVADELGISIPNLAPKEVSREELRELSLGGLYEDPDMVLVVPSSTAYLAERLGDLLRNCGKKG